MPTDDYLSHLRARLAEVDAGIEELETRIHARGAPDTAEALAELSRLRLRHDTLVDRIARAEAADTEDWSTLHTSAREEVDALRDTVERWLTRLD